MEYFFSKSKKGDTIGCGYDDWRQRLSNFYECELEYKGKKFKSIECVFQFMKFEENNKEYAARFEGIDSKEAKRLGGKMMCKKNKVELDIEWWNSVRLNKMKECVKLRCSTDEVYGQIIKCAKEKNIKLVHFSRNDTFWGGKIKENDVIGLNHLGNIIMSM